MLVGWMIDKSGCKIVDGNDPLDYSGLDGKITDLKGHVYYLKTKVYRVFDPKLSNVFVIEKLHFKLDPGRHSIFIESNDGVTYKGRNSYGTNTPIIPIPLDDFENDEKLIVIQNEVTCSKNNCKCISINTIKRTQKMLKGVVSYYRIEIEELISYKMSGEG